MVSEGKVHTWSISGDLFQRYLKFFKMPANRHLELDPTASSAIWSADLKNPAPEPNMKWIRWTIAELRPLEIFQCERSVIGRSSIFMLLTLITSKNKLLVEITCICQYRMMAITLQKKFLKCSYRICGHSNTQTHRPLHKCYFNSHFSCLG